MLRTKSEYHQFDHLLHHEQNAPAISIHSSHSELTDAQTRFGTALTLVAYKGYINLVKLLLEYGADVKSTDGFALQVAAAQGHEEIVKELLERGFDVNACTANENFHAGTALQAAAEAGRLDIVKLLLKQNNVNPSLGPGSHTSPLIAATERGEDEIVEVLIEAHANVNVFGGFDGSTPLIKAAIYLPEKSVELILKAGADINTPDKEGDTALIAAAYRGDQDCVEYLLGEGADIMHSNKAGLNAIQTAVENGSEECLLPLVNHASAILSAIKIAMESGNSVVTNVIRSVKFVKQEGDGRRGSDALFDANDDAVLLASSHSSVRGSVCSEGGANGDDQLMQTIDTNQPASMGLKSLFDQPSKLEGIIEHKRIDTPPPTTFAKLGVDNGLQEPNSNFTTDQPTQQWTPQTDTPLTPQTRIKRKPSPATSYSGQPPLDPSTARSDYTGGPYQQEAQTLPPKQQIAPSLRPRTPLAQSTSSYNPNPTAPQYQTWSPDQNTYINSNQATSPPQKLPQFQIPPPEGQPAPLRPYSPYNPQSYPAEQYPIPTPRWSSGSPPQNQSEQYPIPTPPWGSRSPPQNQSEQYPVQTPPWGSRSPPLNQSQGQGTGYSVENPYDGDEYGGWVGGSGNR